MRSDSRLDSGIFDTFTLLFFKKKKKKIEKMRSGSSHPQTGQYCLAKPTPWPNGSGRATPKALVGGFDHPHFAICGWLNHPQGPWR
jgi:hypothetical protein